MFPDDYFADLFPDDYFSGPTAQPVAPGPDRYPDWTKTTSVPC